MLLTVPSVYLLLVTNLVVCAKNTPKKPILRETAREAVQDLSANGISSSSIEVNWNTPTDTTFLQQYVVNWESFDDRGSAIVSLPHTLYLIQNLLPCTYYTITVTAVYAGSLPDFDDETNANTLERAPDPPTNVRCDLKTADTMLVTWNEPINTYCLNGYLVYLEGESQLSNDTSHDEYFVTIQEYTFNSLEEAYLYTTYVSSTSPSQKLTSENVSCSVVTEGGASGPPENVVAAALTPYTIEVSWEEPESIVGDPPYVYLVNVQNIDTGETCNETTEEMTVLLEDLLACNNYSVTVLLQTDAGDGVESEPTKTETPGNNQPTRLGCFSTSSEIYVNWTTSDPSCSSTSFNVTWHGTVLWIEDGNSTIDGEDVVSGLDFYLPAEDVVPYTSYVICAGTAQDVCCNTQTEQDVPSRPKNVVVEADLTYAGVSWLRPEMINGVIESYVVTTYDENDLEIDSNSVNGDQLSYVVQGLDSCKDYSTAVAAITEAGAGNDNKKNYETVGDDPPVNVVCKIRSDTEADISWDPPRPNRCVTSSYGITWSGQPQWVTTAPEDGELNVNGTITEVTIDDLVPFTDYLFCVSGHMYSNTSECAPNCLTQEGRPSSPEDVKIASTSKTTIKIVWSPPTQINGILVNYDIYWEYPNKTDSVAANVTSYIIKDLDKGQKIFVTVTATTNAGEGPPASANGTTDDVAVGLIVGSTVGVLLLIAILVAAVFIYRKKNARRIGVSRPPAPNPSPPTASPYYDNGAFAGIGSSGLAATSGGIHSHIRKSSSSSDNSRSGDFSNTKF